ncbi:MAG: hypothetical protein GY875_22285 [Gammaproteobacteria bacterium]|nr:hypothetical protein [Gammaproteobacteria bacterium]
MTELEHKLNYPFPTGDYVTLGGFINHRLGRIAGVGDRVQLEGACLEVLKMDRRRNAGRRQAGAPNCLAPSQTGLELEGFFFGLVEIQVEHPERFHDFLPLVIGEAAGNHDLL